MALSKERAAQVNALLSSLASAGVIYVTHNHLTPKGWHSAAKALSGTAAGQVAYTLTHDQLKKWLEDNPHLIPAS